MQINKKNKIGFCFCFLLIVFKQFAFSQQKNYDTLRMEAIFYNGDTIPCSILSNIYVYSTLTEAQKEAIAKYNRLKNAVYVTYPYARKAGVILNEINAKLIGVEENNARRKIINSREKDLKREFTTPLTNLSIYQGKVLMKLINRETGNNCYDIIKEYKGGLTARVYQTVAFFFSSSLKQPYNPSNDDLVIERIVLEVQRLYGYPEIAKSQNL
jgi:hypothetical protein